MTVKNKKALSARSLKLNALLRQKRMEMGLTQADAAEALGVDPQYVSNFERNLHPPSYEHINVLFRLYKIKKSELIDIMLEDRKSFLKKVLN